LQNARYLIVHSILSAHTPLKRPMNRLRAMLEGWFDMSSQNTKAIVLQDVSELLARIPSEDTNTSLKKGSALKNEFGDRGFDLFLQFCSKADNFEANWVKATWRSVKAHKASLGLIFHLAKDLGNVLPRSMARPVKALPISNVLDLDDARRIRFAQQLWRASKPGDHHS
jgi:hypothetical protein